MGKSSKGARITPYLKLKMHEQLNINKESLNLSIFNSEYLNFNNIYTIEDLINSLSLIDFFKNIKHLDKAYPCILHKNSKAWISEDSKGHQRYFTKSLIGDVDSFDILDILEIYYNMSTQEVYLKFKNMLFFHEEELWMSKHSYKYYRNYDILNKIKKTKKYPNLKKIIGDNIDLLKSINHFGEEHIKNKAFTYEDQNIFFFSNGFLLDYSKYKSKSTINKLINLFCCLGLLKKVNPTTIINSANKEKKYKNNLCFYIVHDYSQIINTAEEIAEYLVSRNIKYYSIKKSTVQNIYAKFGVQNLYYGKNRNKSRYKKTKAANIYMCANQHIERFGFVSKELLHIELNCSKKTVDIYWNDIMKKYNLVSKRPTKAQKKIAGLNTNLNIAVKI